MGRRPVRRVGRLAGSPDDLRSPPSTAAPTRSSCLIGDAAARASVRESRIVRLGQGVDRDRPARRRGAGPHVRRGRGVRRADPRARRPARSGPLLRHLGHPRRGERATCSPTASATGSGVWPEVLSGDEEAALVLRRRHPRPRRRRSTEPVLVVDIGGGSTELDRSARAPAPTATAADSMDIGSVRLHERHLHGDPPTADQVARLRGRHRRRLDACPVDPADARTVVGVAGTVITLASGVLGLAAYDRDAIDQARARGRRACTSTSRGWSAMTVARAPGPPLHAPRPRRRDRGRCADPRPRARGVPASPR